MDEEAAARLGLEFDANRQSVAPDFVCFADRLMCLQKCDAVLELDFECISPGGVASIPQAAELCGAEGYLEGSRVFPFSARFSARRLRATRANARSAAAMKSSLFVSSAEGMFFIAVQDLKMSRAVARTSCSLAGRTVPML